MNTTQTFPKTLQEAIRQFSDADTCIQYMMPLVWPNGVTCPHCQAVGEHPFIQSRHIWRCKDCGKQFSIKIGTIMEDSPIGLDKWLVAMWLISNAKNGISSYEIHRAIGVTQKTAWFLLHRIRLAMKTGTFRRLSGTVEADESYVGGKLKNMKKSKVIAMRKASQRPGRPPNNLGGRTLEKAVVMGLLQRTDGDKCSQAHIQLIEGAKKGHVQEVVRANVEPGSMLMTDTLPSYNSLQDQYIHMAINHALEYAKGRIHTNGLENFWSLLKRTINGTYIAIDPVHMQAYLDEQAFRFNNRKLDDATRFARTLGGVGGKRLTLAELTGKIGDTVA